MTKRTKSVIVAALAAALAFMLTGCGARVDYYYSSTNSGAEVRYDVTIDKDIVAELENDKTSSLTVGQYFNTLALAYGFDHITKVGSGSITYSFGGEITSSGDDGDDGEQPTYSIKNGFFTRRVTVTQGNPFNGLRAAYDEGTDLTPGSIIDALRNGIASPTGGKLLPSFIEAFPAAANYNKDELTLRFLWHADVADFEGGTSVVDENGVRWQAWDAKFDRETRDIVYSYTSVNPLGYYVVVLALGAAVTVIIIVATRKSKREPSLVPEGRPAGRQTRVRVYVSDPGEGNRARAELYDLFSGKREQAEKDRLKARLMEFLPEDEAKEAVKKLDEQEKNGKK